MQPANNNMSADTPQDADLPGSEHDASGAEPTVEEIVELVTDVLHAKQYEWSVKWEWVKAETRLVRKSILVTALATLGAFMLACCCWMLLNIGIAAGLHSLLVPDLEIIGGLLLLNGFLCWVAWQTAKRALTLISLSGIAEAALGTDSKRNCDD